MPDVAALAFSFRFSGSVKDTLVVLISHLGMSIQIFIDVVL